MGTTQTEGPVAIKTISFYFSASIFLLQTIRHRQKNGVKKMIDDGERSPRRGDPTFPICAGIDALRSELERGGPLLTAWAE
jgi:hypothetical protein